VVVARPARRPPGRRRQVPPDEPLAPTSRRRARSPPNRGLIGEVAERPPGPASPTTGPPARIPAFAALERSPATGAVPAIFTDDSEPLRGIRQLGDRQRRAGPASVPRAPTGRSLISPTNLSGEATRASVPWANAGNRSTREARVRPRPSPPSAERRDHGVATPPEPPRTRPAPVRTEPDANQQPAAPARTCPPRS